MCIYIHLCRCDFNKIKFVNYSIQISYILCDTNYDDDKDIGAIECRWGIDCDCYYVTYPWWV